VADHLIAWFFGSLFGAVMSVLTNGQTPRDEAPAVIGGIVVASMALGVVVGIVGGLPLDPNDYPCDRPAPTLAVYATCPMEAP